MTLPDLSKMDVSKKMAMAIMGALFVKDITDIYAQAITAAIVIVGIICQTVIDIRKPS